MGANARRTRVLRGEGWAQLGSRSPGLTAAGEVGEAWAEPAEPPACGTWSRPRPGGFGPTPRVGGESGFPPTPRWERLGFRGGTVESGRVSSIPGEGPKP